jgi:glycosyltransferase involved in cell wall biosynthesis
VGDTKPVVSIITPSFNRADIIHETAESIFAQTYPHWEWVIVDDGSTDNSWDIISGYANTDPRVKVFKRNRDPKGAAACRNIAVERSTGEYLVFLDTDDLLASFCLQQRVDAMLQHPEADFLIFPMLLFRQKPDDLRLLWNVDKPADDIDRILMSDAICQGTGTLWKKQSFADIGMWDEQLLLWQDVELHLRSLLKPLRYVKRMDLKPDVFLRVSEVSLSRTGFHSYPKFRSRMRVLEQTLAMADQRGVIDKHKRGLRQMLKDILINAAVSNYHQDLPVILGLNRQYGLYDRKHERLLERYIFLRKTRLYKIPFLQRLAEQGIREHEQESESTLNRVPYEGMVGL